MAATVTLSCPSCARKNRVPGRALDSRTRCGACKTDLGPVSQPVSVIRSDDLDALIQESALPLFVDFWAGWCAPCQMVAPEVAKLAQRRAGRLLVVKADTEADPAFGQRHAIKGIPSFVLFRGGREVGRTSGALPVEGLEQLVDKVLS